MKLTLDGVSREAVVERTAEGFVVTIDDRRHVVTGVSVAAGTLAFLIDRRSHVAHTSSSAGGTEISIGGRTYVHARGDADADHPAVAGVAGDGRLQAPMPGVIVALNVAVGDVVRLGQPIAVLESMKMQNELSSPVNGTVRAVHCRVGGQVAYGEVLVEIGAD